MSQENPKYKPKFNNTNEFVDYVLKTRKWQINSENYRICDEFEKYVKEPDLYILELYDEVDKRDRVNISYERTMPLIQLRIHKMQQVALAKIREEMMSGTREEAEEELDKLAKIVVPDHESEQRDIENDRNKFKYLMLNFVKQIKHKIILEKDLDYPVVPLFYGGQGVAKSKLVKFISEPFGYFVKKMNVEQITDVNRFYRLLRDKIIIRIEELDGADKSNLSVLKSLITDNEITAQKYYSQVPVEEFCYSSFVITSNKPSWEVFRDRSGNRRWGDFLIITEICVNKLNQVNMKKIYNGVPLNNNQEEVDRMREMSEKYLIPDQAKTKYTDIIDDFINELNIVVNEDSTKNVFYNKEELYRDFKSYMKNDPRPYPKDMTDRKLFNSIKDRLKAKEYRGKTKGRDSIAGIRIDLSQYDPNRILAF